MPDANTPVTMGMLKPFSQTMARGVGMLVAMALDECDPGARERLREKLVHALRNELGGVDEGMFLSLAMTGLDEAPPQTR